MRKNKHFLKRERYDYFLIWGHGLKFKGRIIEMIRKQPGIKIIKIIDYEPKDIGKFVKRVYSHDYAPFWHLKGKTEYLKQTPNEVLLIFVHNKDAQEKVVGNGLFKHIECEKITRIKNELRDEFNPKDKSGKRTEDHVIHASDNEDQVENIMKYLKYYEGTNLFRHSPNPVLKLPHYVAEAENIEIKNIDLNKVYCSILQGNKSSFEIKTTPIEETPQYACLKGDKEKYERYLGAFLGGPLSSDYSSSKLLKMSKNFKYLDKYNPTGYILVSELEPEKYLVEDGVHRAAILKNTGKTEVPIAVLR